MSTKKQPSYVFCFFVLSLLLPIQPTQAMLQYTKYETGFNNQNYLTKNKHWVYLLHNQIRLANSNHPLQTILTENSLGYTPNLKQYFWTGFYFGENNPYHQDFKEYKIWEQFYWKIIETKAEKVAYRARIEGADFSNETGQSYVFRQTIGKEDCKRRLGPFCPFVYEEVFLQLNHPDYATSSTLAENHLFVGLTWHPSNKTLWKFGYINEYFPSRPQGPNVMNHVITLNFIFGVPSIILPIDD